MTTEAVRAALSSPESVAPLDDAMPPRTPGDEGGDEPLEAVGATYPQNDTGNGRRFALYCGDDAIYVPRVGWHVWDGRRWKLDPDNIAVQRLGQGVQERITAEVSFLRLTEQEREHEARLALLEARAAAIKGGATPASEDEPGAIRLEIADLRKALWGRGSTRARHISFARSSGNSGAIKNMLGEAVTSLVREVDDLDADPLTVNTETGILRFGVVDMCAEGGGKVAELRLEPHAREVLTSGRNHPQYITKMMPVAYDPAATCPRFDAFLARVQPDPVMRAFLQRWFGLSMTAVPVQKFLYLYGMGANGKSLLANLMRRMMGDYATMVKIESLTGKNRKSGSDATPDLMKLIGARAAITNEPEEGERLQEQKIKEMTGGDAMLVRQLHTDFVEFTPYFKLTFTGNHKLEIRGTDDGIWRRPLLVPFDVQIPERERDEALGDRLFDEERSGILNWMIAGLLDYLEGGLNEPAQVVEATEEYRRDSDPIGDFLATCCVMDGGDAWTPAREVIDACYLYQLENSAHAWMAGSIARKIKDRAGKYTHPRTGRGYSRHKRGVWGYLGMRLTDEMAHKLRLAPRDGKGLPMMVADHDGEDRL